MGYSIERSEDPAAVLGGYRMRLEQGGTVLDDRIVLITERDDGARRLSLFADYLSVPGGMQVYATYHAQQSVNGTRYALDCHANRNVETAQGVTQDAIAAAIARMKLQSDADLLEYLQSMKSRIEVHARDF